MAQNRVGFFDDSLDNFHAEVYLRAFRGPLRERGYVVAGATALQETPSRRWADERELPYFDSVETLAAECDYLMVVAPSSPQQHIPMCQAALPLRFPTFADKTFPPDEQAARAIFALADSCGTPIQTTSALRHTAVQRHIDGLQDPLQSLMVFASGATFEEYGIHPVELAVSCLGPEAESMMRVGPASHPQWLIQFADDRLAIVDFNPHAEIPFSAIVSTQRGHELVVVDNSALFVDAAAAILDFFDAGAPLVDRRETLLVRRILDLAASGEADGRFASLRRAIPAAPAGPHWIRSAASPVAAAP